MKFQPKTKEELSALLAEGEAMFEVTAAEESVSKSGNPMMVLKVNVMDIGGKTATLTKYLATDWAVRNFAYGAGLIEEYQNGEILPHHCVANSKNDKGTGKCIIKIEKGTPRTDGKPGNYPDKNIIANFVEVDEEPVKKEEPFKDDDLNF